VKENERWRMSTGVQVIEVQPGILYSLEAATHLTGVSRRSILVYCKTGLVRPVVDEEYGAMSFDEEAIYNIRKVEYLKRLHGVNLAGIKMIFELMQKVKQLEDEMRFLRTR
jgi:DNA-binding transcriptional MerR regulator